MIVYRCNWCKKEFLPEQITKITMQCGLSTYIGDACEKCVSLMTPPMTKVIEADGIEDPLDGIKARLDEIESKLAQNALTAVKVIPTVVTNDQLGIDVPTSEEVEEEMPEPCEPGDFTNKSGVSIFDIRRRNKGSARVVD